MPPEESFSRLVVQLREMLPRFNAARAPNFIGGREGGRFEPSSTLSTYWLMQRERGGGKETAKECRL